MSWPTSELRVWLVRRETSFSPQVKVPRRCFFCGSFILFLSCFCYAFKHVFFMMYCVHLLGNGWPLGSRLWWLIVKFSLSHWYPRSGMVLDCIDSCSLPSFLLSLLVHCCLVVTCWERADLLALDVMSYCDFVTFPCNFLCQVWYLVVLIPDLCRLSYIYNI